MTGNSKDPESLWNATLADLAIEREIILDTIEQGIRDRMDIDTNARHWAEGALDALRAAGFMVERP